MAEAAIGQDAVAAKLTELLEQADLNTVSERMLFSSLASHFGESVRSQHKQFIKDQITSFLSKVGEDLPPAEARVVLHAGKRKAQAGEEGDSTFAAKRARCDTNAAGEVTVRSFKGKTLCDVREFYTKDDQPAPGKKGIALTEEQWGVLRQHAPSISAALCVQDASYEVSEYKGRWGVDCREMYSKDGEARPGKKGIFLTPEQWELLTGAAHDIDAAMNALSGAAAGASGQKQGQGLETPTGVLARASQQAAPGPAAAGDAGAAVEALPVKLSAMRRADISEFKGKVYINLREYYDSGGELKPGSKGLALTPEQFASIRQAEPAISAALAASDTSFELPLSGRRKLCINLYSGKLLVDLREYYEKDGKAMPGKKGIGLLQEQWQALVRGFPALVDALDARGACVLVVARWPRGRTSGVMQYDTVQVQGWGKQHV